MLLKKTGLLLSLAALLCLPATPAFARFVFADDFGGEPITAADLEEPINEYFGNAKLPKEFGFYEPMNQAFLSWIQRGEGHSSGPTVLQLKNGTRLISGCRPHTCAEKAAIVVDKNNKVLSAAAYNQIDAYNDRGRAFKHLHVVYIFVNPIELNSDNVRPLLDWVNRFQARNPSFTVDRITYAKFDKNPRK